MSIFSPEENIPYTRTVNIADNIRVRGTYQGSRSWEGEYDETLISAVLLLEDDSEIKVDNLCDEIAEMLNMVDYPDGVGGEEEDSVEVIQLDGVHDGIQDHD